MLGWLVDGPEWQIKPSKHKADMIVAELNKLLMKVCHPMPLKHFKSLINKLWHAALLIPAGHVLFTSINNMLLGDPNHMRISACLEVRESLEDWCELIYNASRGPIHVTELVYILFTWDIMGHRPIFLNKDFPEKDALQNKGFEGEVFMIGENINICTGQHILKFLKTHNNTKELFFKSSEI